MEDRDKESEELAVLRAKVRADGRVKSTWSTSKVERKKVEKE